MKNINFNNLLPNEDSADYKNAKNESPYFFLINYSKAINEKYKGKLKAVVTESFQTRTKPGKDDVIRENLIVALYFEAAIGKGYLYRLLEVEQTKSEPYPVVVNVFQNNPSKLGSFKDHHSFQKNMVDFLGSGFVKTLILNLLAQVELYNESRNQKFDWEDKLTE